jgi:hypothetical protein
MRSLACLLLPLAVAGAADTPPEAPAPPQFSTTTRGTVPDLRGRWLVVAQVGLKGNQGASVPITLGWDVTTKDGKPQLEVRYGGLTPDMKAAYDAAVAQRTAWEPTAEQLQDLRDRWDALEPEHPPVASIETTITGRDDPEGFMKTQPEMKDALFAVSIVVNFAPGPERPTKDVMVFGVTDTLPDGYKGTYASVTLANAPFPIPIAFAGTFRMYRLTTPPPASWWERILGMFAGCGRKAS